MEVASFFADISLMTILWVIAVSKKCTGAASPSSLDSTPRSESKSPMTNEAVTAEKPVVNFDTESELRKSKVAKGGMQTMMKSMLEDMPSVSTRGDGPAGKKVEGFLYRYGKGEDVKIVCVCHGNFLSPAEFVKHGGGSDVEHPLKHIVVNPSPFL